jgi:hypothetical protein
MFILNSEKSSCKIPQMKTSLGEERRYELQFRF